MHEGKSLKKECEITDEAWQKFRDALDLDPEKAAERFGKLENRIKTYITTRRGDIRHVEVTDLVAETIRRAVMKIGAEQVRPNSVEAYCLGIARNVLRDNYDVAAEIMERERPLDEAEGYASPSPDDSALESRQLDCLNRCLRAYNYLERHVILKYFDLSKKEGDNKKRRRRLARLLNLKPKALSNRMARRREELFKCVDDCIKESE